MNEKQCPYCTMAERKSGRMTYFQGEPYSDDRFGPDCKATIELDRQYGYLLFIEDYYEYDDETQMVSVRITHCPWCGRELR